MFIHILDLICMSEFLSLLKVQDLSLPVVRKTAVSSGIQTKTLEGLLF